MDRTSSEPDYSMIEQGYVCGLYSYFLVTAICGNTHCPC